MRHHLTRLSGLGGSRGLGQGCAGHPGDGGKACRKLHLQHVPPLVGRHQTQAKETDKFRQGSAASQELMTCFRLAPLSRSELYRDGHGIAVVLWPCLL